MTGPKNPITTLKLLQLTQLIYVLFYRQKN